MIIDAYKSYHKILMKNLDENKTTFYTNKGIYYYTKMPLGLKNTRATYHALIGKKKIMLEFTWNLTWTTWWEKSKTEASLIEDILEMFRNLRRINIKLNSAKCTFGVEEGQFLGYIISPRGMKANPKKIQAILDMTSPKILTQTQSLNGKIVAHSRFLSRVADKSFSFFKVIKSHTEKSS